MTATINGEAPKFFIRDRDDKFGAVFDRVARGSGMRVIKTAVRAPSMNAVMDRFLRGVRNHRFWIRCSPSMNAVSSGSYAST
jgi:hypothetical protein